MAQPTQLAYRTLKGIGILNAAPVYESLPEFTRPEGNLRCCCYSPDGKFFAWASPEQVFVIDASLGHVITTLPAPNVYELGFSPLGTYIITWQRPAKDETGNAIKNLKVWITLDPSQERDVIGSFVQRSQTGWNLQYTSDEKYCARVVTNEVQFYESGNLRQVWNKLIVEGVQDFALSSGQTPAVAIFVPERKGQPAVVKLYIVPSFTAPVAQKTFFKGDKVQMLWNQQGTGLIVHAQTDVDKSNKSYYGESTMFLLTTTGFDSRITLDKEGPIHDVSWSPNSKEFGVVYGFMPAKTTIFNSKAEPTYNFPLGPRNTIAFSPHGRYVLVAGFGNLAGQVDLYDLSKNFAKICTIEASNASVCEWSPDGTHILFATTSPRLRVDNGIRLFHVSGGMMYTEEMEELYHVCWRPQSTAVHTLTADPLRSIPEPHESAKNALAKAKPPPKVVGAYRPPGARGTTTPLHFKREDEGGAAYVAGNGQGGSFANGSGTKGKRTVPGAEFHEDTPVGAAPGGGVYLTADAGDEGLSKAALKNKKKREAKKAKEQAEREKGLSADAAQGLEGAPTGPRHHSTSPHGRHGGQGHQGGHQSAHQGGQIQTQQGGPSNHRRNRSGYDHSPQYGRSPARGPHQLKQQGGGAYAGNTNGGRHGQHPQHQQQQQYQQQSNQLQLQQQHQQSYDQQQFIPQQSYSEAPDVTVTSPGAGSSPHEKKIRSLHKKLRAIEELKMRQAGGEKLEATQLQKITTEDGIRRELEGLGAGTG